MRRVSESSRPEERRGEEWVGFHFETHLEQKCTMGSSSPLPVGG